MNRSHPPRRSTALDEWEPQPSPSYMPQPPRDRRALVLSALGVLLVVVIVGTTALVLRDLRLQRQQTTNTVAATTPTATTVPTTPTPDLRDPANNGWTAVIPQLRFGDVKFAPSKPQRGYVCGTTPDGKTRVFGTTTNGGHKWETGASPAAYPTCNIQISPTNSLNLTLTSINAPGDGNSTYVDAHYSTDGGVTWKAGPIPQGTLAGASAGAAWSGSSLYVWAGPDKGNGQSGFLKVSTSDGAFTTLNESAMIAGASSVQINGGFATGTKIYFDVGYNGCSAQNCEAIVASSDGGQSWTQIPSQNSIVLTQIVGTTLYGTAPGSQPAFSESTDNGATWKTITLPPIPNNASPSGFVVAPDQTVFISSIAGVSYLQNGNWTTRPFSSSDLDSIQVTAVSLDTSGRHEVWGFDDGNHSGVYWQIVP